MSRDALLPQLVSAFLFLSIASAHGQDAVPGLVVGTNQRAAFRTRNFVAYADSHDVARRVAMTAEDCRKRLARLWLGRELPSWSRPCPIRVRVGTIGAGGATTFRFVNGTVTDWKMRVQGSLERILDSVIPHEVNHTIFASHFRRPLPRWADEGAATLFEHDSERSRQLRLLDEVQRRGRRYTLRQLLTMMEYPKDMQRVLTLYAQGYSLVDFLIQQGGRKRFLKFLEDAHRVGWERAITRNYDHRGIDRLDKNWNGWFLAGSPQLASPDTVVAVASHDPSTPGSTDRSRPATRALRPRSRSSVRAPRPAESTRSAAPSRGHSTLRPVNESVDVLQEILKVRIIRRGLVGQKACGQIL